MSLAAAVGILMLVFACGYNKFHTTKGASWVLFVVFFYIVVPVPAVIVHRLKRLRTAFVKDSNLNSWAKKNKDTVIKTEIVADFLLFFTSGIIISSFAFPVVLARAQVIKWGAAAVVMVANIFIFGTMAAFFKRLDEGHRNEALHIDANLNAHASGSEAIFAMLKQIGNTHY
eukprot:Seg422.2 transcript_id=Seg422.2/GoldUCD/mRNA.D3Y31 product="Leptin receptor overlapping transcript-like 1" protein_id=Seg422.2/GoldUCD/D3Y31